MTMEEKDWKEIKHFVRSEFLDSQGECWIDKEFVFKLEQARVLAGVSFVLTSTCRNYKQNILVGGGVNSSHLLGLAADISVTSSRQRAKILPALSLSGFTRIGIGKDFIHVDLDPCKDQVVFWLYK